MADYLCDAWDYSKRERNLWGVIEFIKKKVKCVAIILIMFEIK
jgi:hypothetical protein